MSDDYRTFLRSVDGIGPKSADRLMEEYTTLDDLAVALLASLDEQVGLPWDVAQRLRKALEENGEGEPTVRVRSLNGRPQKIFCRNRGQEEIYEIPDRGVAELPGHIVEDRYVKDLVKANLIRIEE